MEGTNPFPRNALLWVHLGCGPAYSDFHNEQPKACLLIEFGKGVIMYGVWIIVRTSSLKSTIALSVLPVLRTIPKIIIILFSEHEKKYNSFPPGMQMIVF